MELTDLKVFTTIAQAGSITQAAEQLGYVQSNITARIRKLEAELGVPLFHRHPKGVTLTEKGYAFHEYALMILNLASEAIRVTQETSYPSGPLAIGMVETVTCGNFINSLADFQTQYPEVSLSLSIGNSSELLARVLNHQLDGAFVTGDFRSPQLIFEPIMQDEISLLGRDTHPDLAKTKWAVFPEDCPFRMVLETWLHREGITLENSIEISSLDMLLSCVRSGLAATLLPKSVLTAGYENICAYPVPEEFRFIQTGLIRRKDRFASKAFTTFIDIIQSRGL